MHCEILKTRFQPLKGMKPCAMRVADINDIMESSDDSVINLLLENKIPALERHELYAMRVADINDIMESSEEKCYQPFTLFN